MICGLTNVPTDQEGYIQYALHIMGNFHQKISQISQLGAEKIMFTTKR